jgi:hypothetical protein
LGFGGGDWNLFGYAVNSPILVVDPNGQSIVGLKSWFEDNIVNTTVSLVVDGGVPRADLAVDLAGRLVSLGDPNLGQSISGMFSIGSAFFNFPVSVITYEIEEIFWPGKRSREIVETAKANANLLNRYMEFQEKGQKRTDRLHNKLCGWSWFNKTSQVLSNTLGGRCQ